MSKYKYEVKMPFPFNVLIGLPIVIIVFTGISAIFLSIVAVLLSPIIFLIWLVLR